MMQEIDWEIARIRADHAYSPYRSGEQISKLKRNAYLKAYIKTGEIDAERYQDRMATIDAAYRRVMARRGE